MSKTRRVALMLEIEWGCKRHADVFAGVQQFAGRAGWESVIDEYADDSLREGFPYDGVIARATKELLEPAAGRGVPVVNVWLSSPAAEALPGVFPEWAAFGRMYAEHLVQRGLRRFATLGTRSDRADDPIELISLEDLARAKRTQRDKDWPMLRRLVEADYLRSGEASTPEQRRFWLLQAQTASLLCDLAAAHPVEARHLAAKRPLLEDALRGDLDHVHRRLEDEQRAEREADRRYWEPLRRELEQHRRKRRQ